MFQIKETIKMPVLITKSPVRLCLGYCSYFLFSLHLNFSPSGSAIAGNLNWNYFVGNIEATEIRQKVFLQVTWVIILLFKS